MWVVRTVLADGSQTLFELPARSAGEWEWFEDFDGLRSMYQTSRVELGKTLDGIALSEALAKVYDILVGPCRSGSNDWLGKRGLIIVQYLLSRGRLGTWGRRKTMGLRQRAKRTEYEKKSGNVPSSKVSRRRVKARKRESRNRTIYELLFGRLCTDANGIGEEVSLVPAGLGDGLIEEKMSRASMDLRVEPYIPGQIALLVAPLL
jgi:hypothetical protein